MCGLSIPYYIGYLFLAPIVGLHLGYCISNYCYKEFDFF